MANSAKYGTTVLAAAFAILALSGGAATVPSTPEAGSGMPNPYMGSALVGNGLATASVDAYGTIVNLRSPGPAGSPIVLTEYRRQRAGSVEPGSGVVVKASSGGSLKPLWESDHATQTYLPDSNVLTTEVEIDGIEVVITDAADPAGPGFVRLLEARGPEVRLGLSVNLDHDDSDRSIEIESAAGRFTVSSGGRITTCRISPAASIEKPDEAVEIAWHSRDSIRASITCGFEGEHPPPPVATVADAVSADRNWVSRTEPLGPGAPEWAEELNRRSMLVLRALTDSTSGANVAAMREKWHYIWPRDASQAAEALAAGGHLPEARSIARFISSLPVEEGARFAVDGKPVRDGRELQGDGVGWKRLARRAAGLAPERFSLGEWRQRGDYGERDDEVGDFLGNAIVAGLPATQIEAEFQSGDLLVRESMQPGSALDVATAWAVAPFPKPDLRELIRNTLLTLVEDERASGPWGLKPSTDWTGRDPWSAMTATVARSLADLGERSEAMKLLEIIRRSTTSAGLLPERVDAETGDPRSANPLGWAHAITSLALRAMWPSTEVDRRP